jgi:hypothetical protein
MTPDEKEINAQATDAESVEASSNQVEETGLETSQPDESIPEKFRGKSPQEIIRSYKELEKSYGKISSERSHSEKEKEAIAQRLAQVEQQLQVVAASSSQQQSPAPEEADPFASIDEEFEVDPKGVLKKVVRHLSEQPKKLEQRMSTQARAKEAADFYNQQIKENQEFRELEPEMKRLAVQYKDLVKAEHLNSKETMQLLYTLAKGQSVGNYAKAAAEKAVKANNLVKDEKRRAVSESSGAGSTSGSVDFKDLSLDEMRRMLGVSEK